MPWHIKKSLDILSEDKKDGEIDSIEDCVRGLSEIRSWVEKSIKNRVLDSEIEDISNYVKSLEEMTDKMEFIDSTESDSHNTLMAIVKKRFEENSDWFEQQ